MIVVFYKNQEILHLVIARPSLIYRLFIACSSLINRGRIAHESRDYILRNHLAIVK
jgi:hypothetical protein